MFYNVLRTTTWHVFPCAFLSRVVCAVVSDALRLPLSLEKRVSAGEMDPTSRCRSAVGAYLKSSREVYGRMQLIAARLVEDAFEEGFARDPRWRKGEQALSPHRRSKGDSYESEVFQTILFCRLL